MSGHPSRNSFSNSKTDRDHSRCHRGFVAESRSANQCRRDQSNAGTICLHHQRHCAGDVYAAADELMENSATIQRIRHCSLRLLSRHPESHGRYRSRARGDPRRFHFGDPKSSAQRLLAKLRLFNQGTGRSVSGHSRGERRGAREADDLNNLYVRSSTSGISPGGAGGGEFATTTGAASSLVPLRAVTSTKQVLGPQAVNHLNQFTSVTINFNLLPDVAIGDATKYIEDAVRADSADSPPYRRPFKVKRSSFASFSSAPRFCLPPSS